MNPPSGWGLNSFTAAFDAARENQYATFHNKAPAKDDLVQIDWLLWRLLEGKIDPTPLQPMNFFLRSHSCFRAASACAMAGQVYEAVVLQRATLEAAAYGLHIGPNEQRTQLWFSRGNSAAAAERVRKEFSFGSLKRHFRQDFPDIASAFVSLYETLIDFGAHSNEPGLSISTNIRQEEGKRMFDTVYLHGDGLPLDFGLKNAARVGLWTMLAYQKVYPGQFDLAHVAEAVQEMTSRH